MIGKIIGLLGLGVERKAIISSVPFSLGFLGSFNGICKSLFMFCSLKAIGYFYCFNDVFNSDNRYNFVFSSSTVVQMHLAKQNGILLWQLRG